MKSIIIITVMFITYLNIVWSDPIKQEGCIDPITKKTYIVGEQWAHAEWCAQNYCMEKPNRISAISCPLYKIKENCNITEEDTSKPYPECCAHPVCPEEH